MFNFYKVTNEDNSVLVLQGNSNSLEDWKERTGYYDVNGNTAGNVNDFIWYEIPYYISEYIKGGATGATSSDNLGLTSSTITFDGTTAGLVSMTGGVEFGATGSKSAGGVFNSFNIENADVDVVSIPAQVPSELGRQLTDNAASQRTQHGFEIIDPRLSPAIELSQLQEVKELEAKNDFESDDGLGKTQTINFELDNGNQKSAVFDSKRDTMLDLVAVKNYKDLNLSIIAGTSTESVNATKIKVIDTSGTVLSLSSAEFDRMLYAFLKIFYEKYTAKIDMSNSIQNPVGSTPQQQLSYLNNKTNVSLTTSLSSSFVSAALSSSSGGG